MACRALVFAHVYKTGGTTLRHLASAWADPELTVPGFGISAQDPTSRVHPDTWAFSLNTWWTQPWAREWRKHSAATANWTGGALDSSSISLAWRDLHVAARNHDPVHDSALPLLERVRRKLGHGRGARVGGRRRGRTAEARVFVEVHSGQLSTLDVPAWRSSAFCRTTCRCVFLTVLRRPYDYYVSWLQAAAADRASSVSRSLRHATPAERTRARLGPAGAASGGLALVNHSVALADSNSAVAGARRAEARGGSRRDGAIEALAQAVKGALSGAVALQCPPTLPAAARAHSSSAVPPEITCVSGFDVVGRTDALPAAYRAAFELLGQRSFAANHAVRSREAATPVPRRASHAAMLRSAADVAARASADACAFRVRVRAGNGAEAGGALGEAALAGPLAGAQQGLASGARQRAGGSAADAPASRVAPAAGTAAAGLRDCADHQLWSHFFPGGEKALGVRVLRTDPILQHSHQAEANAHGAPAGARRRWQPRARARARITLDVARRAVLRVRRGRAAVR